MSQVVVVTGASSGIGYATAAEFASRGYYVYAAARRLAPMEPLKEKYPELITLVKCDVTEIKDVTHLKELVEKEHGKLDILFNNAGSSCTFPSIDVPDEAALQCYQVNVLAPIRVTRELSRLVIKAKGTIAFTGSIAGYVPFPFAAVYSSTKAAIHQYAQVLHLEMKLFDVKVLNIVTGGVSTNIADTRPLPEGSIFDTVAGRAAFQARKNMSANNAPQSAESFAYEIVNDMIGSKTRIFAVFRGTGWFLPALVRILPTWLVEYALATKFRLFPIKEEIKNKVD